MITIQGIQVRERKKKYIYIIKPLADYKIVVIRLNHKSAVCICLRNAELIQYLYRTSERTQTAVIFFDCFFFFYFG